MERMCEACGIAPAARSMRFCGPCYDAWIARQAEEDAAKIAAYQAGRRERFTPEEIRAQDALDEQRRRFDESQM